MLPSVLYLTTSAKLESVASPVSVMGECAKRAPSQTPWTTARVLWQSAHCTSCRQCKEAMRAVVQRCGDAKLDWITPLTRACIDGRTECVCELSRKPPEVEQCHSSKAEAPVEPPWRHQWMIDFADSERHTALHAACAFGYEDCVRLLIQAGATLDMADDEGDTPLDGALMASSDSGKACVDLLLAAGAKETPQGLVTPSTRAYLDREEVCPQAWQRSTT